MVYYLMEYHVFVMHFFKSVMIYFFPQLNQTRKISGRNKKYLFEINYKVALCSQIENDEHWNYWC